MANIFKFDANQPSRSPLCTACEEMLADALDKTLSPADQAWFDKHITSCVDCSDMFADAQRGAAWLELLKAPRPEPSAALMERILAQTSGQSDTILSPIVIGQPIPDSAPAMPHNNLLPFRLPSFGGKFGAWANASSQPRLLMTAAMAFFSIALTLNLTGVRLDQLKASNLNPNNVRKTYYEASADAVRYYDNLKVVHVMESRVDNLRTSDSDIPRTQDPTPAPASKSEPDANPAPKPDKKDPNGPTSRMESPALRHHFMTTAALAPTARPIPAGGNAPGNAQAASQRAEGPTHLVAQLLFDPRKTAGLKKFTQEGGLA